MKMIPHTFFGGLMIAAIIGALVVSELWFLPILMAAVLVGYIVMNKQMAKHESADSRRGADFPAR